MNDDLIRAQAMLDADKPKEAVKILNRLIDTGDPDAEALFTRGKALWRMGIRDAATNDYAAAAELDPDGPAARALENARDIADFFNPDIYNP